MRVRVRVRVLRVMLKGDEHDGDVVVAAVVVGQGGQLDADLEEALPAQLRPRLQPRAHKVDGVLVGDRVPEAVAGEEEEGGLGGEGHGGDLGLAGDELALERVLDGS